MTEKKMGRPRTRPIKDPNAPPKPRGGRGPRPHVWIIGPDEYKHQMYQPWLMAKAQANFRGEKWTLTFEEYFDIWNGYWDQRGRGADDLCMTREDWSGAWSKDNCQLAVRKEHLKRQGYARRELGMSYKTRGPDRTKRKSKR